MKKEMTIPQMETARELCLKSLNYFLQIREVDAPDFLKHLSPVFAEALLTGIGLPYNREGYCPESTFFTKDLCRASDKIARTVLAADLGFLRKIVESNNDVVQTTSLGMIEGGFPVRVQGQTIHCLWSGRLRDKPYSDDEVEDLARQSGLSVMEIRQKIHMVPVWSSRQIELLMEMCRRLRFSLEQAFSYHVRAQDLTRQLVQAERAHSLGTISGGVAHHFNNLLSIILGYSSMILNRAVLSGEEDKALKSIIDAAQKGRRLTDEVLAFLGSEVESEAPCHTHDMMTNSLSLLESQISSGIRVDTRLGATNDTVLAPASSIRQILFNLLTNACDSMPDGGFLTITTGNVTMQNKQEKEQEFLCLEVADSSQPLPAEPVKSMTRKESSPIPQGWKRTDLKLSSVYGMVGQLEGSVMVSSDPGTVTRVQVYLPVIPQKSAATEPHRARHHLAPSHVWVVDDDEIFCAMCRQLLQEEGHVVDVMTSGRALQEAWQSKQQKRPDLILLDFSMPEFNGLQLCEWLKAKGSKTPIILVSGFGPTQPDIKKALKMKKTGFLQKPFTARELTDTMTVALGETLLGE